MAWALSIARDNLLNRPVAVKVLNASGLGTEGKTRLLAEARAAAKLNHPNRSWLENVRDNQEIVAEWNIRTTHPSETRPDGQT